MRLLLHALLLLWQPGGVWAWALGQTTTVDVLDPNEDAKWLYRWTAGNSTTWTEGLKGGITWAVDPNFCSQLLARMPEETETRKGLWGFFKATTPPFLTCLDVTRIIRTSLAAWSMANENVRFFEVNSLCEDKWQSVGGPGLANVTQNTTNSSGAVVETLVEVETTAACSRVPGDTQSVGCATCSHAELVFGLYRRDDNAGSGGEGAARVLYVNAAAGAPLVGVADYQPGGWERGKDNLPWLGGSPQLDYAAGGKLESAFVEYSVGDAQCWWLDPDWCALFFSTRGERA